VKQGFPYYFEGKNGVPVLGRVPWSALFGALLALFLVAFLASCGGGAKPQQQAPAMQQAQAQAQANNVYIPKNHVEQNNYNLRQQIADNPATIIWCTSAFSTPGAPMFTVPIIGKLTSGGKRPLPTEQAQIDTDTFGYTYYPELPGPDGMYGSSGEYRYGFGPDGTYYEFYGIETTCSSQPTIFQKENTKIVGGIDPALAAAQQQASKLVSDACGPDATAPQYQTQACKDAQVKAGQLLNEAIKQAGGR
jgi:hypothetical protein